MLHAYCNTLAATWFDRLLGLDSERLSFFNEEARLAFERELPGWVWLLIVLGAVLLAAWSYSGMTALSSAGARGTRLGRWSLTALRAALIVFVIALLAGPTLILPRELVEPDYLLVLVDRSASLQTRDAAAAGAGAVSREESLRQALLAQADVFGPDGLSKERRVVWMGFDDGAYDLPAPRAGGMDWQAPGGHTTSIRTAINQSLRRAAGQPVSGIVLFTDGRSPQPTSGDWARRLGQQAVSVFPVPLGSATPVLDLAIGVVEAPERAFIEDVVPVTVWLEKYPAQVDGVDGEDGSADGSLDPARVSVKLVDIATGRTLDERNLGADGAGGATGAGRLSEPVHLSVEPDRVGPAQWRVEVSYDAPTGTLSEVNLENNVQQVSVELVDRPIRVLYVEGYPRWEYRYLKSMLIREKSITSSMILRSADREFLQEGDEPLARLPRTAEEFESFDVIIIGDVPRNYWSPQQLAVMRDHVAYRGAGVLWIGGEYFTPRTYDSPPMSELLPMRFPGEVQRDALELGEIDMIPTALARALHVLRLTVPSESRTSRGSANRRVMNAAGAADPFWPGDLQALRWVQDLGALKPGAEVLAMGRREVSEAQPLVTRLRFGAGQSIYIATDDTWRWRHGFGEIYFERFWIQLVRMLARDRLTADQDRATLRVSHRRVERDQAVVVELRMSDALRSGELGDSVQAQVRPARPAQAADEVFSGTRDATVIERLELTRQRTSGDDEGASNAGEAMSDGSGLAGTVFQTVWRPTSVGRQRVTLDDPALGELGLEATIEVIDPNDEMRQPLPDHERLENLAADTGGQMVKLDELDQLLAHVPNRSRRINDDISERLWDSPMSLVIVLMLLTCEWIGRKFMRLM